MTIDISPELEEKLDVEAVPYPMVGEDAQARVTRTRRKGDEHRERMLRREVAE